MKKKTASTVWVRGEGVVVVIESSSHTASPLALPVEVVLFFTFPVATILGIPYCNAIVNNLPAELKISDVTVNKFSQTKYKPSAAVQ